MTGQSPESFLSRTLGEIRRDRHRDRREDGDGFRGEGEHSSTPADAAVPGSIAASTAEMYRSPNHSSLKDNTKYPEYIPFDASFGIPPSDQGSMSPGSASSTSVNPYAGTSSSRRMDSGVAARSPQLNERPTSTTSPAISPSSEAPSNSLHSGRIPEAGSTSSVFSNSQANLDNPESENFAPMTSAANLKTPAWRPGGRRPQNWRDSLPVEQKDIATQTENPLLNYTDESTQTETGLDQPASEPGKATTIQAIDPSSLPRIPEHNTPQTSTGRQRQGSRTVRERSSSGSASNRDRKHLRGGAGKREREKRRDSIQETASGLKREVLDLGPLRFDRAMYNL